MANPIYQQINGTGIATAVILDNTQTPFNVSFAVEIANGTCAYTVQFTLDNPNSAIDYGFPGYLGTTVNATVSWQNDVNVGSSATTVALTGNYMFPVRALRCNVASASTTGTLQLVFAVLQGNPPSG